MTLPKYIKKRDGKTTRFEGYKIKGAILKAANSIQIENPDIAVEKIYLKTLEKFDENSYEIHSIDEIEDKFYLSSFIIR